MIYLRQSTASQAILLGPFIDKTDGFTAETGLTIANTDIRLSAAGGNMFAKTSGGGTHDEAGWYTITLDATDTATVGSLQISCQIEADALPVFVPCVVLEEIVYDQLYDTGSEGSQNTIGSSAVNVRAIAAPNGFTMITGSEVNDEDDTYALGTRHELTDDAGTLDCYYEFDILADGKPSSVTIVGVFNGSNDSFVVSANSGTDSTPVWEVLGTIQGTNSTGNLTHAFPLFEDQIVSDVVGRVQIRINNTGLTAASCDIDRISVAKSVVARSAGYADGAVWIDTVNGIAGTTPYIHGVADRHVDSIADALTIAAGLPTTLVDFHIINGSTITLAASAENKTFVGDHWTLELGGQACGGIHVEGANVTGTGTSAGEEMQFVHCDIGAATVEQIKANDCGFYGTLTMNTADDYEFHHCFEKGAVVPVFTKTAGQTITAEWWQWAGDITISGVESGDAYILAGDEVGDIILNGADGTVEVRGIYKSITDNRTGSPVLTITGAIQAGDVASMVTTLANPAGFKKNTAADLNFAMLDSTTKNPRASETVTATRSIDSGAFAACANSVSEIANGIYSITLAAADLNGDIVTVRFTSSNCDPQNITIKTEP